MAPNNGNRGSMVGRFLRLRVVIPTAIGVGAVCWLASGFYTVASDERGVVTRFGAFHRKVPPGIHYAFGWPIERVYTPRVTDVKRSSSCSSSRGPSGAR